MRVHGGGLAVAVRLLDDQVYFFRRIEARIHRRAAAGDAAGGEEFYQIGAGRQVLADMAADFLRPVARRQPGAVAVPRRDRARRNDQARPGNAAGGDCGLDVDIQEVFLADHAHGGDAGAQVGAQVGDRPQHRRDRAAAQLRQLVAEAGDDGKMRVRIDQSGQDGLLAAVDDGGALGHRHVREPADARDAPVLHPHGAAGDRGAPGAVDQRAGFYDRDVHMLSSPPLRRLHHAAIAISTPNKPTEEPHARYRHGPRRSDHRASLAAGPDPRAVLAVPGPRGAGRRTEANIRGPVLEFPRPRSGYPRTRRLPHHLRRPDAGHRGARRGGTNPRVREPLRPSRRADRVRGQRQRQGFHLRLSLLAL